MHDAWNRFVKRDHQTQAPEPLPPLSRGQRTGAPVDRPKVLETTALGVAYLAGLQAGLYPQLETFAERWSRDRRFEPAMPEDERQRKLHIWKQAVRRLIGR